ncbi:thiamine monophosphate kinase [Bradyrhizobium sp. F1.13.4]
MANPHDSSAEDSLIARYFKPLATDPGALGLVDDAAILQALGSDIVVTTDAVVEGVHYFATDPPDTIARKALRVNLSDLAAKGAVPAGFVLTLALRAARKTPGSGRSRTRSARMRKPSPVRCSAAIRCRRRGRR